MKQHVCLNCGALLKKEGVTYACPYCRATYEDDAEARASSTLKSLLDKERLDRYRKAKQVLYNAVHARYPSAQEVLSAAQAVLAIENQDVLASVYLFSHDEDSYRLNQYLVSLKVPPVIADEILRWLLPSLNRRSGAALKHFVELNYSGKELTARLTEVEDAIEKADAGTYEAGMIRDVFVAYSSADMEEVVHLVDFLEENGLTCFVSFRNLRHGKGAAENYLAETHKAMAACSVFLLVSSPHSLDANCDAIRDELPFLCANLPEKPRIQYVIKDAPRVSLIVRRNLKAAFPSQEWCRDEGDLLTRIYGSIDRPNAEEMELPRDCEKPNSVPMDMEEKVFGIEPREAFVSFEGCRFRFALARKCCVYRYEKLIGINFSVFFDHIDGRTIFNLPQIISDGVDSSSDGMFLELEVQALNRADMDFHVLGQFRFNIRRKEWVTRELRVSSDYIGQDFGFTIGFEYTLYRVETRYSGFLKKRRDTFVFGKTDPNTYRLETQIKRTDADSTDDTDAILEAILAGKGIR